MPKFQDGEAENPGGEAGLDLYGNQPIGGNWSHPLKMEILFALMSGMKPDEIMKAFDVDQEKS